MTAPSRDRIFCAVPGCRRYTKNETALRRWGTLNVDVICAYHWRRLTGAERRVWARLKRLARRYGWEAAGKRSDRIWTALKRRSAEGQG